MKILFLILSLFTQTAFAEVLFCKQKFLPIKTEYSLSRNSAVVKITAEKTLKNFEVVSVSGLRGLTVQSKTDVPIQDLKRGDTISINVEYSKPEGQSFLVINVKGNSNAVSKGQSLPIPVGELSFAQIQDRKKNIKSFPSVQQKDGTSALESETKYHTMKLPE
jgi:hypothetical protein